MALSSITLNTKFTPQYALENRYWQGCPTILKTPRGRLFAGWYSGGTGEPDPENYNLLIRSDDNGWTWKDPELIITSEPEKNFMAIDIQLWLDPAERMWLFITQRYYGDDLKVTDREHLALWAVICDDPDADVLQWSKPRFISNGFLRTQPTVLSNGDWVLCAYNWIDSKYSYCRSKDNGKTWQDCSAGTKLLPDFDESMILERKDGTLLMFARDFRPLMVKCTSSDLEGTSWTNGTYTSIINARSRFFLRRLKSGRVLLIHNDAAQWRDNLCAKLSEDDGETWKYSLTLDNAECKVRNVSYPDAVEDENGNIFIIYDRGRTTFKEILMAQITEEDIINGSLCRHSSYLRRVISKAPEPADHDVFQQRQNENKLWKDRVMQKLYREHDLFSGRIK